MQRPRRPNRQGGRGGQSNNQTPDHLRNRPWHTLPQHSNSNSPRPPRPAPTHTPVPSYAAITLGSSVSIVLKEDQPTGRQVQGIVGEVLTSGDHPRGVKVKLRDGRVGRVQKLVPQDEGERGEEEAGGKDAKLGRNGESMGGFASASREGGRGRGDGKSVRRGRERGRGGFRHVEDARNEEYVWDENRNQTLGSYFSGLDALEAKDAEDKGWVGVGQGNRGLKSEMATCPVCGVFEGDERAVAHHVEGHFADGQA